MTTRAGRLDAFSRRVVGWSMADHLRTELLVEALEMAVWNLGLARSVIHHSIIDAIMPFCSSGTTARR